MSFVIAHLCKRCQSECILRFGRWYCETCGHYDGPTSIQPRPAQEGGKP